MCVASIFLISFQALQWKRLMTGSITHSLILILLKEEEEEDFLNKNGILTRFLREDAFEEEDNLGMMIFRLSVIGDDNLW